MNAKSLKSALSSAAVLALGALALTACQAGTTGTAAGASPSTAASSPASGGTGGSGVAPVSAPSSSSAHGGGSGSGGTSTGTGAGTGSGGDATSDSYAYKHPCSMEQLSVKVTRRPQAPSQRVIAVRNTGSKSCGLSYFPLVYLDQANTSGQTVKPLVPGGLGGAPAYPVYAGRTAYAVIDLDPSGATSGTVAGIDELNVLADGDHMPNADTLNFPLGSGALVLKPKLGLYESSVADAVSSMQSADTQA